MKERKEPTPLQILIDETVSICQGHLDKDIDRLVGDDITIIIVGGHGKGIYAQARMIVDVIKGPLTPNNRVQGYIILDDQVLNHPGPATRGETFPVNVDELSQLLHKLKTFTPKDLIYLE